MLKNITWAETTQRTGRGVFNAYLHYRTATHEERWLIHGSAKLSYIARWAETGRIFRLGRYKEMS